MKNSEDNWTRPACYGKRCRQRSRTNARVASSYGPLARIQQPIHHERSSRWPSGTWIRSPSRRGCRLDSPTWASTTATSTETRARSQPRPPWPASVPRLGWKGTRTDLAGADLDGIDALRIALLFADEHPTKHVVIAGHTDTVGADKPNVALSERRALSVHAFLSGQKENWASISFENETVADWQAIMTWATAEFGWDSFPGPIDGVMGPLTEEGRRRFRTRYNETFSASLAIEGPFSFDDWLAAYDLYVRALARRLEVDDADVAQLQSGVSTGSRPFLACGERFPAVASGVDNHASAANRRVEIVFYDPENPPDLEAVPDGAGLYGPDADVRRIDLVLRPGPRPEIPTISLVRVRVAVGGGFREGTSFSPRLAESAELLIRLSGLTSSAPSTVVRVDIGRATSTGLTRVARVEQPVVLTGPTMEVPIRWHGRSTAAVAQELSARQTRDHNSGSDVPVPMPAIPSGTPATHGVYVVEEVSLLSGGAPLASHRPADQQLGVPTLVNLVFNGAWSTDLAAFGLAAFSADLQEALRRFGGRDYAVRTAAVGDRINVKFFTGTVGNGDCMRVSVGGNRSSGMFGSTPDGPAPLSDNLYAIHDGLSADITAFPGTFMLFNTPAGSIGPTDQALFQSTFAPLGVGATANAGSPGVAAPRTVGPSGVSGATDAVDAGNVTVVLDDDGLATVSSTSPAVVPPARATAIQGAMRAFVRMVGNTINHEVAHGLGVVSRVRGNNSLTITGTTLTSPLDGDGEARAPITGFRHCRHPTAGQRITIVGARWQHPGKAVHQHAADNSYTRSELDLPTVHGAFRTRLSAAGSIV
ncbi:MAG: hypothetical protein B7733_06080 [Myxococcales bacterium FL481]|nr:MAG: hypothetical protein B7733_06080 [Myxococcales bacterium FL481]